MKLQSLPKLRPITKLSPTMFATLQQCPLQAGLRQVKAQRTTRSSTAALLGTIVHRVLEKAGSINKDSADLRTQAEAIWDKAVEQMEEDLQTSPLDKYLLPIRKWRKFFVLQQRTLRRCEEIASSQGISETQVIASERRFDSVRSGFTGKPDLILRRANGLVIIDYKSGELPDDPQIREEKIEPWQQQILIYASMIEEEFGEWPVDGKIRLLNKEVIPIVIDPREVKDIRQTAQELREEYNTKIKAGVTHSELAQYSVDNCRFCEFKGACNTFWKENPQPIPETDEYGCLSGQVLKVTTGKGRNSSMAIICEKSDGSSQEWQISNLSTEQFGNLEELKQGTLVRLLNFKIESDESYRAKPTQTSVIWEVPVGL
ncbi:MAG: PD-(D/E)XK nuclease family protein [Candidatus Poribacteria bacterium]|nr:PD-(D/E)XK nuclease family protein [Candidatus Poribacteria bacterium]